MKPTLRLLALCLGAAVLSPHAALAQRSIEVVSSPPNLVTTPGVLVRVRGVTSPPVGWASNDTLITPFYANEDGDWFGWIGLMDLLKPDPLQRIFVVPDARAPMAEFELIISVFSPDQPLFAGPRPAPAPCQNQAMGLGAPADEATCAAQGSIRYIYKTTGGTWAPYPATGTPGDVARTTTTRGKDVPMVVRLETGVINRAPYAIALLAEPATDPAPGKPWPTTLWNGGLVYGAGDAFGLGVQSATRAGFIDVGHAAAAPSCAEALLAAGYAIAAAQTPTGPAANDIVAAETLLRVRERFIKRYALPKATVGIGAGEAGAALARIAKAYPGLDSVGPGTDPLLAAAARSCG
jgi:hypothetical protein